MVGRANGSPTKVAALAEQRLAPGYGLCLRAHCYKFLLVLVAILLLLQYTFISIFEARQLEPLFAIIAPTYSRAVPLPLGGAALRRRAWTSSANESAGTASEDDAWATPASLLSKVLYGRPDCPIIAPNLIAEPEGPVLIPVKTTKLTEVERLFRHLEAGGAWRPRNCTARHRVAIIIPYRDRAVNLAVLLQTLHPFLQRQQLDYRILVVEQAGRAIFNKGMLMNIGFVEALKLYDFQCFFFHDVDLLPEDNRNLYTCPEQPRHVSVSVSSHSYRLLYESLFGGVTAMTKFQFQKVNGFSNMFWGWGAEDDDMSNRIRFHGFRISRYPAYLARYRALAHPKRRANSARFALLYSGPRRFKTDGLNSLSWLRG